MSCFEGQMREYRQISIDRFDKKNLKSTVYFLSHCHRDHMVGLDNPSFVKHLKMSDGVFLYCSDVTKLLLLSEDMFKHLAPYTNIIADFRDFVGLAMRVLELGVPTTITIPDPESKQFKSVLVTTLPAGHCPGSVMFLFEGNEGTALYTGDFRWEKNFAVTLPALCINGQMKEIDHMYVDSTFCIPEAFYIPSRDHCLEATASLVTAWLQKSPSHFVYVSSRTKYGHEPLLAHLARETDTKVHVSKAKVDVYENISELQGIFTEDPRARIHACAWQQDRDDNSRLPCGHIFNDDGKLNITTSSTSVNVMVIRPSTMWFTAEPARLQELVVSPSSSRGIHRVCYSFHSSYSELRDLISLLQPQHVFPNVLPMSDTSWDQVIARLRSFLKHPHRHHLATAGDCTSLKPFGLLKRKRTASIQVQSDSEGLVFDSPEISKPLSSKKLKVGTDLKLSSQESSKSSVISTVKSEKSDIQSSYQGSDCNDSDLFSSNEEEVVLEGKLNEDGQPMNQIALAATEGESLRSYVSGDEDMPKEDQVSSPKFRFLSSQDDAQSKNTTNVDDEIENNMVSVENEVTTNIVCGNKLKISVFEATASPSFQKNVVLPSEKSSRSVSRAGPEANTLSDSIKGTQLSLDRCLLQQTKASVTNHICTAKSGEHQSSNATVSETAIENGKFSMDQIGFSHISKTNSDLDLQNEINISSSQDVIVVSSSQETLKENSLGSMSSSQDSTASQYFKFSKAVPNSHMQIDGEASFGTLIRPERESSQESLKLFRSISKSLKEAKHFSLLENPTGKYRKLMETQNSKSHLHRKFQKNLSQDQYIVQDNDNEAFHDADVEDNLDEEITSTNYNYHLPQIHKSIRIACQDVIVIDEDSLPSVNNSGLTTLSAIPKANRSSSSLKSHCINPLDVEKSKQSHNSQSSSADVSQKSPHRAIKNVANSEHAHCEVNIKSKRVGDDQSFTCVEGYDNNHSDDTLPPSSPVDVSDCSDTNCIAQRPRASTSDKGITEQTCHAVRPDRLDSTVCLRTVLDKEDVGIIDLTEDDI